MTNVTTRGRGAVVLAMLVALMAGAAGPAPAAETGALDQAITELRLTPGGGEKVKPLSLPGLDGKRVRLRDLSGRPVLIYFWATW